MALRCTVEVGATGRSPRVGRSPSPGRRLPGRRGPPLPPGVSDRSGRSGRGAPRRLPLGRSLRSPRSPRSSPSRSRSGRRVRLPEPGARITETSGARRGVPMTSIRPGAFSGERDGLTSASDRISIPSSPVSISARSTDPTAWLSGTNAASTTPLGWRAPAARHVHDPSPLLLVSSISIRRDMRRTRYRAGGPIWCSAPREAGTGGDVGPITSLYCDDRSVECRLGVSR